jgi:hypothetical protein
MSDWGKGVNNNIGWGQGADNNIGWGSIYDKSNAGETLLKSDLNIDAFTIEVKTDNAGTSNDNQFQFTGAVGDYNVVAKQNDIIVQTFSDLSDETTITFANGAGTYVLEVNAKGTNGFTGIRFRNRGDKDKLVKINNWGVFSDTRDRLFQGCENLTTLPQNNDYLNQIIDITTIFRECHNLILPDSLTFEAAVIGTNALLFNNLTSLPPLMNLPNLQVADNMLRGNSFTDLPVGMTLPNLTDGTNFLLDSTINTERYSQLLVDMAAGNNNTNVPFHGGNSKYNDAGEVARDLLIANQNWTFTDGGKE